MSYELNAQGWALMILSIAGVWALAIWCYYVLLTAPEPSDDE